MGKFYEVRWHARAGQGAITASRALAEAALKAGKFVQALPDFGPERTGAPMRAFNRISDVPIRIHSAVTSPDLVVVVDPSLIKGANVAEGVTDKTVFVVNTSSSPAKLAGQLQLNGHKVYCINASQISMDCIGMLKPTTPLLGAIARATGIIPIDTILEETEKSYGKKFDQKVVEGNLKAIKRAYNEVTSNE